MPIYRVTVEIDPRCEIVHRSFVYAGLFDLAAEQQIALELRWQPWVDSFAIGCDVERVSDGAHRRIVFDIQDRSYRFSTGELEKADVYFKRSHHAPDVAALAPEHAAKVRAFGPVFVTRSAHSRANLALGALRHARSIAALRQLSDYLRLPPTRAFERAADAPAEPRVLFQTRLWTDAEVTGEPPAAEINAERVAVVRALRSRLGARFVGGLLPTPLAIERHADLVCTGDTRRRAYLAQMHRCAVGVYTRGLHHSIAWKLGEYLASSCAIVTSPFRNTIPPELQFIAFQNPDDCADQCARLLDDPDRLHALREASAAHYRACASPPAQILRCLDAAFDA